MGTKNRLKIILYASAAIAVLLFIYRDVLFPAKPGFMHALKKPLPEVTLQKSDGTKVSLKGLVDNAGTGKVILSLWATWCEPCTHELPLLDLARARLAKDDTSVVLINYDGGLPEKSMPEVKAWLLSRGLKFETYFDFKEQMLSTFKVEGLPFTMAIGKDRTVQWMRIGELDWTDNSVHVD